MPTKIGSIVNGPETDSKPDGNGFPTIKLDSTPVSGDSIVSDPPGERSPEPQIINGYESADPDATIRIEQPKRKGGRPKGWRKGSGSYSAYTGGSNQEETPDSIIDLATLLLSIHQLGAAIVDIKELELDKTEAQQYADALKQLMAHYPRKFNPKAVAWLNFMVVVGGIYGTRFTAYRMRIKEENKDKPKVVNINRPQLGVKVNGKTQETTAVQATAPYVWEAPTDLGGSF